MKKFLVSLMTILASFSLLSAPVMAVEDDTEDKKDSSDLCTTGSFLGFVPWYRGLTEKKNGKCEIKTPIENGGEEEKGDLTLTKLVVTVILNVTADLSLAVGYLAIGFVIYGGYLYIMSEGDPGKVAKGKKTIVSAVIGIVISISANVIMNLIVAALTSK